VLCSFLSACGFHLRGMIDIPTWLEAVSVVNESDNRDLVNLLSAQLEGYKIKVNEDPTKSNYWIIINNSILNQQIISIGSSTTPRQYQLTLETHFTLKSRDGRIIKPTQTVTSSRQFTSNNDRILGSNEEEALLVKEMRQDTVGQIINRLSKMQ
jgi:LPS-assembly lipoprotein